MIWRMFCLHQRQQQKGRDRVVKESLKLTIDKLNKQFGSGAVWSALDTIPAVSVISTGAYTLDKALGVGGLPRGRITEIFGVEASGKTTLALSVIANIQAAGGDAAIIDVEHSLDLTYAKALGVNVQELLISQPDTGEQALSIAETLVRQKIDCVVIDSVAMLVTEAEIAGEMTDMQVGAQARLIGKGLRKLIGPIDKADTVFILINQLREKVGGYGNPEITPGGRALKYMSSVRIDLRKKEQIKDADQSIGIRVVAKVVKNKVAPPSTQAEFSIYYGKGIDSLGSLADAATSQGLVTRAGAWYSYKGTQIGQGISSVIERLKTDEKFRKEIINEI